MLISKCTSEVKLGMSSFQTNLESNRWILGNWTMKQLIHDYAFRSMNESRVSNCPPSHPFFNDVDCIECPSIFNIETKKCTDCTDGTTFNSSSHSCEPPKTPENKTAAPAPSNTTNNTTSVTPKANESFPENNTTPSNGTAN